MKSSLSLRVASRIGLASMLVFAGAAMAACSATPDPGSQTRGGSGGSSNSSGSGGGNLATGGAIGPIEIPDSGGGGMRQVRCDDAGVCTCINVVVLGRMPSYGAGPAGTDTTIAFQNYLNSKSSATVSIITTDTELTPEFLANYDVIILQALEDKEGGPYWSFTAEEIANVQAWVEAGGGIISLMGYGASANEVDPTNTLLSFTGLAYAKDDVLGDTCGPSTPAPGNCCYCAPTSYPLQGWNGAHPISRSLTRVGAFHGRSVTFTAPDAEIVAQGPLNYTTGAQANVVYGATRQIGQGRVFMFTDEWVTYTSQWNGTTLEPSAVAPCTQDPGNVCYNTTADKYYTVPQFWFNTLLWISGDRECFDINDPVIVK